MAKDQAKKEEAKKEEATTGTKRYKVTAPARDKEGSLVFSGRTCGVKFEYGVAVFDDYSLQQSRNSTQRTADEIADIMQKDFGYTVEVVG